MLILMLALLGVGLVFLSELGYEEEHDFWIATRKDYVQRPEVKVLIECIRDATLKI